MDYRYETSNESREFHQQRLAFVIINGILHFMNNSKLSHYEYCAERGISKDEFNNLIRGYYMNGNVVFYKGNFTYDKEMIPECLNYVRAIKLKTNIDKMDIYFGVIIDEKNEVWPFDYYYGYISEDNQIVKNNNEEKEPIML